MGRESFLLLELKTQTRKRETEKAKIKDKKSTSTHLPTEKLVACKSLSISENETQDRDFVRNKKNGKEE